MREPAQTSRILERIGRRLTVRINGALEKSLSNKFATSEPPAPGQLAWRSIGGVIAHEELKDLVFGSVGDYLARVFPSPPSEQIGKINERCAFSVRLKRRSGIAKNGQQTHYLLVDGIIQLTANGWLFTYTNLVPIPPPPELPQ